MRNHDEAKPITLSAAFTQIKLLVGDRHHRDCGRPALAPVVPGQVYGHMEHHRLRWPKPEDIIARVKNDLDLLDLRWLQERLLGQ